MLQICSDGLLWSTDSEVKFWQQLQRTMLSIDVTWQDCCVDQVFLESRSKIGLLLC